MFFFILVLYFAALPVFFGVSGLPEFFTDYRRRTAAPHSLGKTGRMAELYASVSRVVASPMYSALRCSPRALLGRFAASGLSFLASIGTALHAVSSERGIFARDTAAALLFFSVLAVYFGIWRGLLLAAAGGICAGGVMRLLFLLRLENRGAALLAAAACTALLLLLSRDYLHAAHRTYYIATTAFLRGSSLISLPFSLSIPADVRLTAVQLLLPEGGRWERRYFLDAPNCLCRRTAAMGGALLGFVAERDNPEVTYYLLLPPETGAEQVELLFHDFRRESLSVSYPAEGADACYRGLLPTQEELFENYNRILLDDVAGTPNAELVFDLSFPDRGAADRFAACVRVGGGQAELEEGQESDGAPLYTVLLTEQLSLSFTAVTARCRELLREAHAAGGELAAWYTANRERG